MKEKNYEGVLGEVIRQVYPIVIAGFGGYFFAEGDIRSTLTFGVISAIGLYENLSERLPNRNNSSNGLEQEVSE